MSLINQMLKDLEARNRSRAKTDISLSGLEAVKDMDDERNLTRWTSISIALVIMLFLVVRIHLANTHQKTQKNAPILATQSMMTANPVDIEIPNLHAAPAILTGITLQSQENLTFLRFILSQNVLYRINSDMNKHQLIIIMEHAELTTRVPMMNYEQTGIQNISLANSKNGDLHITIHLKKNTELAHLELNDAGKLPELQLELYQSPQNDNWLPPLEVANKAAIVEQRDTPVKKFVIDMTAEEEYTNALQYSANGQYSKAITQLSQLIKKYPLFNTARQTLVTLLLQQKENFHANEILQIGMQLQPDYIPFREQRARMLVDAGKANDALNLLEEVSPAIKKYPDYYALIAALYQQKGQAAMAAKLYEQLLMIQPAKAVWWMALGISLDSIGHHAAAVEAFTRAQNHAGLSPEVRAYVESRLSMDTYS